MYRFISWYKRLLWTCRKSYQKYLIEGYAAKRQYDQFTKHQTEGFDWTKDTAVLFHDKQGTVEAGCRSRLQTINRNISCEIDFDSGTFNKELTDVVPVSPVGIRLFYELSPPPFRFRIPGNKGSIRKTWEFSLFRI